jgi:hypothetical protein
MRDSMDRSWEPPKTLRQIERELVADMDNARRDYERICRELNSARDTLINPENAATVRDLAHVHYRRALQRFTDFVAHGKFPAASVPSRQPAPGSGTRAAKGGAS